MRKITIGYLLATLMWSFSVSAVEAPKIEIGDYLFIRAHVVGCEPGLKWVEFGEVANDGDVTFFDDINISADGKHIHVVADALVDALEQKQGYRPKTVEVVRFPKSDMKSIAFLLTVFTKQGSIQCPPRKDIDENPIWNFDSEIAKGVPHNKSFRRDGRAAP